MKTVVLALVISPMMTCQLASMVLKLISSKGIIPSQHLDHFMEVNILGLVALLEPTPTPQVFNVTVTVHTNSV